MKSETYTKQVAALLKNGGTKHKELDDRIALRNRNIRGASLHMKKEFERHISQNNLILGKKMHEIFTRKTSNYGEITMKESPSITNHEGSKKKMKGLKFNHSSRSNLDYLMNPNMTDQ